MAKKWLVPINLAQQELQNAVVQQLAADPSSPVKGQTYYNTGTNRIRTYNGATWDEYTTGAGSGTVTTISVVTANGFAGTVATPTTTPAITLTTSVTGLLKGNGTAVSAAASGTDYAPATAVTSSLKGNGSGGFAAATLNDNGAATADYSINSHKLTNLLDPTAAQDAATKNYVDLAVQGITWKAAVRAATTVTGALASAYANASVIDGVTLATGDRILLKNQSTPSENGIYTVAASGAPTRATDMDANTEVPQAAVFVREGTTLADSAWVCSNDGAITLGTTGLTFVQFSTAGGVQSSTTTVAGITRYATTVETLAKSVSTAAVTPASLTNFPAKYVATIGDGATTAIAVTHSLGSQDVIAQVRDASTNAVVECDITQTSTTVTTFTFTTAPAINAYKVVIIG